MKLYIFENYLFCAIDVVIATSLAEAKKIHKAANCGSYDKIHIHKIKPGFVISGGGNG